MRKYVTSTERDASERTTGLWLVIAVASLVLLYIFVDGGVFLRRFFTLGIRAGEILSWPEYVSKRSVYIFMHVVGIITLLLFALSKKYIVFIPLLVLIFAATAFDLTYFFASERYALYSDVSVLSEAIGNTSDAIQEYRSATIKGLAAASLFYVCLLTLAFLIRRSRPYRWAGRFGMLGLLSLFCLYFYIGSTKGDAGLSGFPRGYSSLFSEILISVQGSNELDTGFSHLRPVTPDFAFDRIIVVMDESVLGAEFRSQAGRVSIENTYLHLKSVYSGANISAASNYFFRKAGQVSGKIVQTASLFEQARKAGYRTIYIDNQTILKDAGAKNYLDSKEEAFIDEIVPNYQADRFLRDPASLHQLIGISAKPGKTFVYVNKLGAHVPYEVTIPPGNRSGDRLEDYRRSVRINSVEYVRALASLLDEKTVLIYTSDHGQNLGKGPTHGNSGDSASAMEWDVPFAVSSGNQSFMRSLAASSIVSGRYISHFDIAELVRSLLGYHLDGAEKSMGHGGEPRLQGSYCAYFGSPRSSFGGAASEPKCRLLPLE
jgi:glucan phosphoethanolaminetransferase (alkaline phosphatase superfamily)